MALIPYHEVRDHSKVARLMDAMEQHGWQGPPIVVDSEQALTGVHRIAAWRALGRPDFDIPTIELRDVFAEAGLDMDELHALWGHPTLDDPAFVQFVNAIPKHIRAKYGLDIQ